MGAPVKQSTQFRAVLVPGHMTEELAPQPVHDPVYIQAGPPLGPGGVALLGVGGQPVGTLQGGGVLYCVV